MSQSLQFKDYPERMIKKILKQDIPLHFINPVIIAGKVITKAKISGPTVYIFTGEWEVTENPDIIFEILLEIERMKKERLKGRILFGKTG